MREKLKIVSLNSLNLKKNSKDDMENDLQEPSYFFNFSNF